jgi:hypothetical protein
VCYHISFIMKTFIAASAILFVTASHLFAQGAQAEMVKQKALGVRDANNARQGVIANGAAPAPAAPAPAAPAQPATMSAAQQKLVDKVHTDFLTIKPGGDVTAEQKQTLQGDMLTLAKGATKPSAELLNHLTASLSAVLSDKNVTVKDPMQLAKSVNVMVNSSNLSASQVQSFLTATQNMLKSSGASDAQVTPVINDMRALANEQHANRPKLYQ